MNEKRYHCQLCYTNDPTNQISNDAFTLEEFIEHMIGSHNSIKIQEMLETLNKFGGIKE